MARFTPPADRRWGHSVPGAVEAVFAGSELNVAVAYSAFGGAAAIVTALPDHPWTPLVLAEIRRRGVDAAQTLAGQSGRLGMYFIEPGLLGRSTTIHYDRKGSAFAETPGEAYDWESVFSGEPGLFFMSGISPAVAPDASAVALEAALSAGWTIAFDPNIRRTLWTPGTEGDPIGHAARVMREITAKAHILIGSPSQAAFLTGHAMVGEESDPAGAEGAAAALAERFPNLQWIAFGLRKTMSAESCTLAGFLYNTRLRTGVAVPRSLDTQAFKPHEVPLAVDRIGTGDAMAAGLLFALHSDTVETPENTMAFAVAAGYLNHGVYGDFHMGSAEEVLAVMRGDNTGYVKR